MKYSEFKLDENLQKGIAEAGYSECTPVQEETLKQTLECKDVCVQSQTGTGKTAAFLVSIFHLFENDPSLETKQALIVAPTRELAVQIEEEAKLLGKYLDYKIGSIYGGVGYAQQEELIKSGVNIIVGTPGRLIDLNLSNKLKFRTISIMVIDEADRLFDMGFLPDLKRILKKMSPSSKRRTMLFGATLNPRVQNLAKDYMTRPANIEIEPEMVTVDKIAQELYHVGQKEKMSLLLGLLKREQPKNVLIFTNTKRAAAEISQRLEYNGFPSEYLIGDLPQKKRLQVINGFKDGKFPILVATDVAARGLHVNELELVINYDLPEDCENYVHRIGRTARAGKSGKAVSLPCEQFVYGIEAIESYINMKIPVSYADDELFEKDKSAGIRFLSKTGELAKPRQRNSPAHSKPVRNKPAQNKSTAPTQSKSKKPVTVKKKVHKTDTAAQSHRKVSKKKAAPENVSARPPKAKDLQSRLDYYSEKYGENFTASNGKQSKEKTEGKQSLIKKISRVFKKSK